MNGLNEIISVTSILGGGRGRLEESVGDERQVQYEGIHLLHTRGRGLGRVLRLRPSLKGWQPNSPGTALTFFSRFCST